MKRLHLYGKITVLPDMRRCVQVRTYLSTTRFAQLVRTNDRLSKSTMLMPSFRWPCSTCAATLAPSSSRTCNHLPFSRAVAVK